MNLGLYIHIPFCQVKCRFCDFAAYPGLLKKIPEYLQALAKEFSFHKGARLETVYVGGGTPTMLNPGQLAFLFEQLQKNFSLSEDCEITVECNPESTDDSKLETLFASGVNRLSFGLQTTQERLLKALGRLHSFHQFCEVYAKAREKGFRNLNIDLMYGLPGQTLPDWNETISAVIDLNPEHLSAYALTVEERSAFKYDGVRVSDELEAEMYEHLAVTLEAAGFVHYEISNFARPDLECKHNLRYWRNLDTLGAGVSAASFVGGVRRKNNERVEAYLQAIRENRLPVIEEVTLAESERLGEDLMLGLRLKEGVKLSQSADKYYGSPLRKFEEQGCLIFDGDRVKPTRKGWLLSNQLFMELLAPSPV